MPLCSGINKVVVNQILSTSFLCSGFPLFPSGIVIDLHPGLCGLRRDWHWFVCRGYNGIEVVTMGCSVGLLQWMAVLIFCSLIICHCEVDRCWCLQFVSSVTCTYQRHWDVGFCTSSITSQHDEIWRKLSRSPLETHLPVPLEKTNEKVLFLSLTNQDILVNNTKKGNEGWWEVKE